MYNCNQVTSNKKERIQQRGKIHKPGFYSHICIGCSFSFESQEEEEEEEKDLIRENNQQQ